MRNWVLYLHDINEAISTIHEFIAGMTLEEFSRDKKTMSAVRDQIMIIGEAVNHLPDEILSGYPQVPWRDIVGMRTSWFTRISVPIQNCSSWLPPSGLHHYHLSSPG